MDASKLLVNYVELLSIQLHLFKHMNIRTCILSTFSISNCIVFEILFSNQVFVLYLVIQLVFVLAIKVFDLNPGRKQLSEVLMYV